MIKLQPTKTKPLVAVYSKARSTFCHGIPECQKCGYGHEERRFSGCFGAQNTIRIVIAVVQVSIEHFWNVLAGGWFVLLLEILSS